MFSVPALTSTFSVYVLPLSVSLPWDTENVETETAFLERTPKPLKSNYIHIYRNKKMLFPFPFFLCVGVQPKTRQQCVSAQ
jgi:hypothetical protein